MKLTKTYKVAHYDELAADRDKYMLAFYDVMNGKFTKPVTVKGPDDTQKIRVSLSWRANPLFLIEWFDEEGVRTGISVYTEDQLEAATRGTTSIDSMMSDAFLQLRAKYYPMPEVRR